MEIWLRQNKKSFRFAILPSEYELTSESDNTQVNINKLGEINLIGKRKLKTVSFSSIFPKQKCSFCQYSTFPTPKESVKTIEKMKDGVIILNTARGPLIQEQDLADALCGGKVYAAAMDVVSTEPIKGDNPLLHAPNCIITPHIAWAPKESRQRIMDTTAQNIQAFLSHKPVHVVND